MRPLCVSNHMFTTLLSQKYLFFVLKGVWEQKRKSWCVQTLSLFFFLKTAVTDKTKTFFLMICLDVQPELTLQSDMDHWVYGALSELTSEDLSPLSASLSPPVSGKSNQKQLYWHERKQKKCCQASFPLNNIIQWDINTITCSLTSTKDWHLYLKGREISLRERVQGRRKGRRFKRKWGLGGRRGER